MQRSRLKNIINKSKESSKPVGDSFELFKKSLPKEIEIGDDYRLEAAWKAYGSPKDYKAALWEGMIQPIDENNYKLPSIGYNEDTDEYEYLNKGEDNETVAKDIRVWDNDVIPFVKELKLGGYVRLFNEEKNCWTYTKNSQKREQPVEDKGEQVIDSFQKGGKPKLDSKESGEEPVGYLNNGTPLYRKGDGTIGPLTKENIGKDNLFDLIKNSNANWAKRLQDPNRKYITYPDGSYGNFKLAWSEDETGTIVYPEIQEINGQLVDLSEDREKAWKSAIEHKDYIYFPSNDAADWFTKNYKNYYKGFDKTPRAFKQGGQMSVIPEGALHARKNNMEGAGEDITAKGIPVVDNQGEQQAEIEREEIIYSKKATDTIEKAYKEFYQEGTSESRKEELAINIGKFLTKEILENTQDNTGLIEKVAGKNNLEYTK